MIHKVLPKITDQVDFQTEGRLVSYLNIYNYKLLRNQKEVVDKIDAFTLDGIMMIIFLKVFFRKKFERKAPDFSSYFTTLFARLEEQKKKLGFIGGTENEMEAFVNTVKNSYPELEISHAISGYNLDEVQTMAQLLANPPDVLVVGMGTPRQEMFLATLKGMGFKGLLFSCGAFISQTATKGKYYFPEIINKLHLRWAYRIYTDPKLFRRYAFSYPHALMLLVGDFFKNR